MGEVFSALYWRQIMQHGHVYTLHVLHWNDHNNQSKENCITGGECIPTADQVTCRQWCPRLLVNSFPRCLWKRVLTSCTKLYSIPGTLGWPDATGHSSHPSNIWHQMVSLTHWGQGIITSVEQWLFYTYFDHKWGVVMCCCAIYNDKSKSSDKKKPVNKLGICSG